MQTTRIGLDLKLFGALFVVVGAVDLVIIALFPSYALKLFGTAITGPASFLVKLHSPAIHLVIGYGFLFLRTWAWGLAVAYSGFGIASEIMNQMAFGYHPVRAAFVLSTLLFLGYLVWRRSLFDDPPRKDARAKPASQETL